MSLKAIEQGWQMVEGWLPAPLWDLVGDYAGDGERAELLDPVLSIGRKSAGFLQKVKAYRVEYERNLKIFWGSVLYAEVRVNFLIGAKPTFLDRLKEIVNGAHSSLQAAMGADEYGLLTKSVAQKECPADATGELIKRVLHHRSMRPLFGKIETMKYQPVYHEIQSKESHYSLVVKELGLLTNVTQLTFEKAGQLTGPADLTKLTSLAFLDMQKSGLKIADLCLGSRVKVWADELPDSARYLEPQAKQKRFRLFHSA